MESAAVVILVVTAVILCLKSLFKKRPWGTSLGKALWFGGTITGKAFVIDGDTIRVSGQTIRLSGLDAPELNQWAKHQHGYWYKEGMQVKSVLIRAIGGKNVQVKVEGYDKYVRVIGTVMFNDKDIGEWLVRNGYAVAAYGDQYKHLEREARRSRRGRWGQAEVYDPRTWRYR